MGGGQKHGRVKNLTLARSLRSKTRLLTLEKRQSGRKLEDSLRQTNKKGRKQKWNGSKTRLLQHLKGARPSPPHFLATIGCKMGEFEGGREIEWAMAKCGWSISLAKARFDMIKWWTKEVGSAKSCLGAV